MAQAHNQFDKIRNDSDNEVLECEGAFNPSKVSMSLSNSDHSLVRANQEPTRHQIYMETSYNMTRKRAIALDAIPSTFSDPEYADNRGEERLQSRHADQIELEYSQAPGKDWIYIETWGIPRNLVIRFLYS